jgi:hypothetical protein
MRILTSLLLLITAALAIGQDDGIRWRQYVNRRWGFCVSYPVNWDAMQALNGGGIALTPKAAGALVTEQITVGGSLNRPRLADQHDSTLDDNFDDELGALRQFGGSELEVLERKASELKGVPSLVTKIRFKAAKGSAAGPGGSRVQQSIWSIKDGVVFILTLKARPEGFADLSPLFDRVVGTFRFGCVPPEKLP